MLETPVLGLITLLASQISDLVLSLTSGAQDIDLQKLAIALNVLVIVIYANVAIFVYEKEQSKEVIKETGELKKLTVKEKLSAAIFYERAPFKAVWWHRVCIYSILVTIIMSLANSDYITLLNSGWALKIYAAVALSIEVIELIAMFTVSTFTYEILAIKTLLETFTVVELMGYTEFDTELQTKLVYILIEFAILGYSLARFQARKKNTETAENKNKDLKEIKSTIKLDKISNIKTPEHIEVESVSLEELNLDKDTTDKVSEKDEVEQVESNEKSE
jgi:hypothetical protein